MDIVGMLLIFIGIGSADSDWIGAPLSLIGAGMFMLYMHEKRNQKKKTTEGTAKESKGERSI